MNRQPIIFFCLSYIIGLFTTGIFGFPNPNPSWQQWTIVITILISLTLISAIFIPKIWLIRIKWQAWIIAGLIAIFAVFYLQWRLPRPENTDISYQLNPPEQPTKVVEIQGKILDEPRVNRKQKVRFWFQVEQLKNSDQPVTGKLYVTVPLLQGSGLYPGQNITIKGLLYQPQFPSNPGGFNFKKYLAKEGSFAGLSGFQVIDSQPEKAPKFGLWQLRKRIIRAQTNWLKSPSGQLLSSIVLGSKAVDLPSDIQDPFIKVGLAHVLAASGFHVSLLLGAVLFLTRNLTEKTKLIIGLITIITYLSLTGFFPSIIRAGIMGIAVLIGMVKDQKVRPLGSLLLAAIIMLIINPLWIFNLGFQLSFLATFGLMVSLPTIQQKLDMIPPTIANIIAIPVAASLWTLPLIGYSFNTVSTYSIIVNILTTPLIIIISLGGMISGLFALIYPLAGSATAWLLKYPLQLLIIIVNFFEKLPGSSWSIGKISLGVMLVIYGLMGLILINQWGKKYWKFIGIFILSLVIIPIIYQRMFLLQVTVFDPKDQPVILIQDHGKTTLINSGDADTVNYTLLPFLAAEGINHLDYGIALESKANLSEGWSTILNRFNVKHFRGNLSTVEVQNYQQLAPEETISTPSLKLKLIDSKALQLNVKAQDWLILNQNLPIRNLNFQPDVLIFSGNNLDQKWLNNLKNSVIITTNKNLDIFAKSDLKLYQTELEGAIQWTKKRGFYQLIIDD